MTMRYRYLVRSIAFLLLKRYDLRDLVTLTFVLLNFDAGIHRGARTDGAFLIMIRRLQMIR